MRFPLIPGEGMLPSSVITHVTPTALPDNFEDIDATAPVTDRYQQPQTEVSEQPVLEIKRRRRVRRLAMFMVLILLFGGGLYATGVYIRGTGLWALSWNPFHSQTATANTDVNLRSEPNASSDSIGVVTRNSKVRIVNSQNNWYQVDVIQQGRDRTGGPNATRGWLNGRYIDIDDN